MTRTTITGRLTADAVLRYTKSQTPVINCRCAVFRKYDREHNPISDFYDVVIWGDSEMPGASQLLAETMKKGTYMLFDGRMESYEYADKNGNKRTGWQLVASYKERLSAPKNATSEEPEAAAADDPSEFVNEFHELMDESEADLPF